MWINTTNFIYKIERWLKVKKVQEKQEKDEKYISNCKIICSDIWSEEIKRNISVWGLEVYFSDGEVVSFPDLCTKESDIEGLRTRLEGADLLPPFLMDVIEDYLGYIYGLT